MFRDSLIIYRKELHNLIKDKRTLFLMLVLPLLLMPAVFIIISTVQQSQAREAAETIYGIHLQNAPSDEVYKHLSDYLTAYPASSDQEGVTIVTFPEGYERGARAKVSITYKSTSNKSTYASRRIQAALRAYDESLAEETLNEKGLSLNDLHTLEITMIDTAPEEARGSGITAVILPYFILIYVFSGAMSVGMDTTAGEKERGSLASVLVNQVSRTSIAIGKVAYVVTSAVINSLVSFLGIVLAFLYLGSQGSSEFSTSVELFSFSNVVGLLLTLVSIGALAASIIVFLGCNAKNVKEGMSYVMPVYILVILAGISSMQMDPSRNISLFLIPVLNGIFSLKSILTGQLDIAQLAVTIGVNFAVSAVIIRLTAKLFNSEKILNTI